MLQRYKGQSLTSGKGDDRAARKLQEANSVIKNLKATIEQ